MDNGDLTIENISDKIEMIKELIEQLKKEREDDFTNEKERNGIKKEPVNNVSNNREIQRIQIRLNNYNNKYDHWMDQINNPKSVEPAASALGESCVVGSLLVILSEIRRIRKF